MIVVAKEDEEGGGRGRRRNGRIPGEGGGEVRLQVFQP